MLASARYFLYNKIYPKVNAAFYRFKHWGYPKYIAPKTFKKSEQKVIVEEEKKEDVREKIKKS